MIPLFIRRLFWSLRPGTFRYWDGQRWRSAQPLRTYFELFSAEHLGPDPDHFLNQAAKYEDRNCIEAIDRAGRDVLGIKPFEDGGLSDLEVVAVVGQFVAYSHGVKKNIGMRLAPLPSMGATSAKLSEPTPSDSLPTGFSPPKCDDTKLNPSEKGPQSPSPAPSEESSPEIGSTP